MSTELMVALVSGAVALSAAGLAIWGQIRSAQLDAQLQDLRTAEERRFESERTVSRYREPLARSAFDLQSQLYNILNQGLIECYFDKGNDRERAYIINYTAFLVAQISCMNRDYTS